MNVYRKLALLLCLVLLTAAQAAPEKLVIAHRGASGYLPEHSAPAQAAAHAMGADYIEQDLVMTRDRRVVVLHDIHLDRVTNVRQAYPQRRRADGRWYAIDFSLEELRGLEMTERFRHHDGRQRPVYPRRFPLWQSSFRVMTLEESIELIQGMNRSTGRTAGIYPEVKAPWFHRQEGFDISRTVLGILKRYGYRDRDDAVFVQCFDPNELRRIHAELLPELDMDLRLIQLLAENDWRETMVPGDDGLEPYDYRPLFSQAGLREIAAYAHGIGPSIDMIVQPGSTQGDLHITALVDQARAAGLAVHAYTFRRDPGALPDYVSDFNELLELFLYRIGIDGLFTDFPDLAVQYRAAHP